jgi:hypothetical protein
VIKRMNIEKIRSKKALKFLGLLISAMVIASVSAATYNMFMNATVGVEPTELSFVEKDPDFTTCGGAITDAGQKVTFSTLNGQPGLEAIFNPVDISNGAGAAHDIELVLDSWTGDSQTNLYNITVTMYNGGAPQGASIVLRPASEGTSVTTSGTVNIAISETWEVEWTVYWKGSAAPGTDAVNVYLLLVVS